VSAYQLRRLLRPRQPAQGLAEAASANNETGAGCLGLAWLKRASLGEDRVFHHDSSFLYCAIR